MEQQEDTATCSAGTKTERPDASGPDTAVGTSGEAGAEVSAGTAQENPAEREDRPDELESLRRRYEELQAKYDAEVANRANTQASLGSVSGGEAVERDYYSSQEWDRLPAHLRRKFIQNGRIFDFMKKWSEKQ